jgi:hypothetical protein
MGVVEEPVDGRGGEGLGSWRETDSAIPRAHPAIASVLVSVRSVAELEMDAAFAASSIPAAVWQEMAAAGLLAEGVPLPS